MRPTEKVLLAAWSADAISQGFEPRKRELAKLEQKQAKQQMKG